MEAQRRIVFWLSDSNMPPAAVARRARTAAIRLAPRALASRMLWYSCFEEPPGAQPRSQAGSLVS